MDKSCGRINSIADVSVRPNTRRLSTSNIKAAHMVPKVHPGEAVPKHAMSGAETGLPQRMMFCVHGNPEGCCVSVLASKNNEEAGKTIRLEGEDYHCHRDRGSDSARVARKRLWIAAILCLIFMICEVIGGYMSGSLAIATDAAHLLTDFASFMISLIAIWVASRPATKKMPFGWYRAEVIGALTSVLMIWIVTGILIYIATRRLLTMDFDIDEKIMLYTSTFGFMVNVLMGFTLHPHAHSHGGDTHSHGGDTNTHGSDNHSHGGETHTHGGASHSHGTQGNLNVRVAFIHVMGDILQSFGVFVAAVTIYFKPEWAVVDPICTFLFAILVLGTTITILRDVMTVLMEGIPRHVKYMDVVNTFSSIEGVIKVHNLRIWALSLDKAALSAHIAVAPGADTREVLSRVSKLLATKFNFFEMTLQIEEMNESMASCEQCQGPLPRLLSPISNPA